MHVKHERQPKFSRSLSRVKRAYRMVDVNCADVCTPAKIEHQIRGLCPTLRIPRDHPRIERKAHAVEWYWYHFEPKFTRLLRQKSSSRARNDAVIPVFC